MAVELTGYLIVSKRIMHSNNIFSCANLLPECIRSENILKRYDNSVSSKFLTIIQTFRFLIHISVSECRSPVLLKG